jgi:RHS repeat-associated protein
VDASGSTSLTTDANGDFVARVLYYPYGEKRYVEGTLTTDYQYTGQRKEGFGLYDYNARYYDPYLARFVSADTVVPEPENPQDWNRYSYVRNNPVLYTDFSDNRPCGPACREDITTHEVFRCNGTQCWNQSAPEYGLGLGNGQGFDAHDAEMVAFVAVGLTGIGLAEYAVLGGGGAAVYELVGEAVVKTALAHPTLAKILGIPVAAGIHELSDGDDDEMRVADVLLDTVSKPKAREALRSGIDGLTSGQGKRALKILGKGRMESVRKWECQVVTQVSGAHSGFARYTYTIDPSGKLVDLLQLGFNSSGELIHVHDKLTE